MRKVPAPPPPASPLWDGAAAVAARLRAGGYETRFAGGCVRDLLLGRPAVDIDLATAARPDQVQQVFPDARWVGRAFGVCLVVHGDQTYEIATYRKDLAYHDGRHPEGVVFADAGEDARRRDFTVNGLFYDPADGRVYDHVGGLDDLGQRTIRAIGNPTERFREDALRLLRAVRFAAVLEFTLDPATRDAVRELAGTLRRVSAERIRDELTRLLCEAPRAGGGLRLLDETGLLREVLPEVAAMHGVEQPPEFHPEGDVFNHTALMLDLMETPADPALAWSVLLHDVGKPPTATIGPDKRGGERIRFDGHDAVGADIAETMLTRLKCSRRLIDEVVHCVRSHMHFVNLPAMRESRVRRFLGHPAFDTLLDLHRLDCLGSHGKLDLYRDALSRREAFAREPVLPERWITGRDLLALGLDPGPEIGLWLTAAYEAQLERRFPDRDTLLAALAERIQTGEPPDSLG